MGPLTSLTLGHGDRPSTTSQAAGPVPRPTVMAGALADNPVGKESFQTENITPRRDARRWFLAR